MQSYVKRDAVDWGNWPEMKVWGSHMTASIGEIFAELGFGEKLYDFYRKAICTRQYRYVIIVPRKCMTEYKCLCEERKDLAFQAQEVYYMTSKSFVQYKGQMIMDFSANCDEYPSVLIVDDIMMHGRGINQILRNLTKDVPSEARRRMINHIYINVFIESNKKFLIDEEFLPIIEDNSDCYYFYNEFKNVLKASDLFLESFYAKLVPNTSFVNAWYCKDGSEGHRMKAELDAKADNGVKKSDGEDSIFVYKIGEKEDQRKHDFHSLIYCEKQVPWIENVAEFCCIRAYYSEKENKIFFVPYVFLKPMTGKQIDHLLAEFQETLSLPRIWNEQQADDDMYIFKYEYLTKLFSDCYGLLFMSGNLSDEWHRMEHWDDIYREDDIVTEFTFGKDNVLPMEKLYHIIKNGTSDMIHQICWENPADEIAAFDEETDSVRLFIDAVERTNAVYEQTLNIFLKYSSLKDEELAEAGKERYFGLSTMSIKNILEERNRLKEVEKLVLYGEMIRCMDTGTAAVSIKKMQYHNKIYYGAVLNSGEQAYRELQEKNSVAIHFMALIEQDCTNLCIRKQTESIIDAFWKDVECNYKYDDLSERMEGVSEVRRTVRNRCGRYSEMDVERSVKSDEQFIGICQEAYKKIAY